MLGETLRSICAGWTWPAISTVLLWVREDEAFADRYAQARQIGYQTMADELIDVSRTPSPRTKRNTKRKYTEFADGNTTMADVEENEETYDAVDARRLQVDTLKWFVAKALPKIYGDKLTVEPPSVPGGGFTLTFVKPPQ